MPVVDYAALPEFVMRTGISGKWLAGREQGATAVSVLSNTVEPGIVVPRHMHDHEELVMVEEGEMWVEVGDTRLSAVPGRLVIVPPSTPHAWGTVGSGKCRVLFIWPMLDPFAPDKSKYLDGAPPAVS